MAQQRLDKIIASTGRYSRREVKTLVREGRVLVDGRIAASAEDKCDPLTARISVNGEELFYREHTYVMLHKPAGVLSATEDGRGETVLDLLAPEYRKIGLFPVGRLDKDTEGLLLLTDDGALAHDLLAPKKHVDKVYFVRTDGALDDADCKAFEQGITLGDGLECLPAKLEILKSDAQSEALITIREGKFHQILTVLLQGVVGVLRVIGGHALVAAHGGKLLQKLVLGDAKGTEQLGGVLGRLIQQAEEHMLHADVLLSLIHI